jgi:hypothetical protein
VHPVQPPQQPGRQGHGLVLDRLPRRPQHLSGPGTQHRVAEVPGELTNPQHGADIIVKLATDPAFADAGGGYFAARAAEPLQCPEIGRCEGIQCALWEATADLVHTIRRPHGA